MYSGHKSLKGLITKKNFIPFSKIQMLSLLILMELFGIKVELRHLVIVLLILLGVRIIMGI